MAELMKKYTSPKGEDVLSKTVRINAPVSKIWEGLTNPVIMKKWMSETEIDILTDWKVESPIILRGRLHGIKFENKGRVLQFEPEKILQYSHLSSLSRLPDRTENYSVLDFRLATNEPQTALTLTLSNFPTESIDKHLAFYWNVTLEIFKRLMEEPD